MTTEEERQSLSSHTQVDVYFLTSDKGLRYFSFTHIICSFEFIFRCKRVTHKSGGPFPSLSRLMAVSSTRPEEKDPSVSGCDD